jgi:hypothetical protein
VSKVENGGVASGLREIVVGSVVPMFGAALLGSLFDWLLSLNLNHSRVLNGAIWILSLTLLGMYLDYRKGFLREQDPSSHPELMRAAAVFIVNLVISFWLVHLLWSLGLGFDVTMIFPALYWIMVLLTVLTVFIAGKATERDGQ